MKYTRNNDGTLSPVTRYKRRNFREFVFIHEGKEVVMRSKSYDTATRKFKELYN